MLPLNKIALAVGILLGLAPAGFAVEQRCGWLGNPTQAVRALSFLSWQSSGVRHGVRRVRRRVPSAA